MPTLAYATAIEPFLRNSVLDEAVARHFPGASVWPAAATAARSRGWEFDTADVVLERVRSGDIHARDVWVIQEEEASLGTELLDAGARASLLLCGESPLFAQGFYQRLDKISQVFRRALLFRGALGSIAESTQGHVLHFPGFHRSTHTDLCPWESRGDVVMVAGNKYWWHEGLPMKERLRRTWRTLKEKSYVEWLGKHQLHDRRLEYVTGLSKSGILTLFGPGWNTVHHLPSRWHRQLASAGVQGQSLDYSQKHSTVGGFKFSLVIENFDYPGYVTEKIVDAMAAGTIPLYLGAPDIEDFIPSELYVDLREFSSPADLASHLDDMDEEFGMAMITRGQEFLMSSRGDVFSFQHQGEHIVDLATR